MLSDTRKILSSAGIDGFVFFLIVAVFFAWLLPSVGASEARFSLYWFANIGISLIFFFYGLKLSREKLRTGLNNKYLHFLIHITTFLVFPTFALLLRPIFRGDNMEILWLGIFYLATLPSTVSSSVVMVSIARGNIPAAIFNASISSLIGVFITPLWMSFVLASAIGIDISAFGAIIGKLMLQVLAPVLLGMALNKRWGHIAESRKKNISIFDQSIILLIVYTSFCKSFAHNVFAGFSHYTFICCAIGMLIFFFAVYRLIGFVCKRLKMSREDTITAQFCGSKKSMIHGAAMSKVIFAGFSGLGIILLPVMLYHTLQLVIVSAIAKSKQNQDIP